MLTNVVNFLPRLVSFLVILIVGYFLAKAIAKVLNGILPAKSNWARSGVGVTFFWLRQGKGLTTHSLLKAAKTSGQ